MGGRTAGGSRLPRMPLYAVKLRHSTALLYQAVLPLLVVEGTEQIQVVLPAIDTSNVYAFFVIYAFLGPLKAQWAKMTI